MSEAIDRLMESASQALADMDYLTCEANCLEALAQARADNDWSYYARILLPLQEARRQRRMIAAEGRVRLGSAMLDGSPETWLQQIDTGCIALTRPHTPEDAARLRKLARDQRFYVEVLYADNTSDEPRWTLQSTANISAEKAMPAPRRDWVEKWLSNLDQQKMDQATTGSATPSDWFLDAAEALGDAAMAGLNEESGLRSQLAYLESCLEIVTDHEILHQRLGKLARELQRSEG